MGGSFFAELKRRNVIRAAILYVGAVWALAQGISQLGPSFGAPEWSVRWFVAAAAIGFPFWVAFAWFYEWTPAGFRREREVEAGESITPRTGRRLDFIIIGVMAVAIVLLVTDRFVLRHGVNARDEVVVSEKSIAVLPFVDMSQGKDQEYFSDGISEELLNLLAKIPTLHVAARTSSFSFKGKDTPIPDIAKTLHVANVLEGSVRKSGDQLRITAQLIRAADGYHVWSETWDRKLDDVFKIQDEIAGKVVDELKVTLLGATPKARTTDPRAYALYLQAVQLGRQQTAETLAKSDDLLQQVLAIDPRYAPAWGELGKNFVNKINIDLLPAEEGFTRARQAINKALEIDPDNAVAHTRLGFIALTFGNDPAAATKEYERALALDPANVDVLANTSILLRYLGRNDDALTLQEAVARRDPVNLIALYNLGRLQRDAGRYDDAIGTYRTLLSLSPRRGGAHGELGLTLLLKGEAAGALTEFEQEKGESARLPGLAMAYHVLGRKNEAEAALATLIAKYEKENPFAVAQVYAFDGDADKTFEWLDKSVEYKDPGLVEIVTGNLFDKVHADPRWLPFLRKIGKAQEQLAKIDFKVTLPVEWQAEATAEATAKPSTTAR